MYGYHTLKSVHMTVRRKTAHECDMEPDSPHVLPDRLLGWGPCRMDRVEPFAQTLESRVVPMVQRVEPGQQL